MWVYATMHMQKWEDNLQEWVLSFHHVVPGIGVKLAELAAGFFTC